MGTKTNAELIDRVEEILEDSGNAIFTAADISSQFQDSITEASEFVSQLVKHIIPVTNGSKIIDISGITGLIDVDRAEYKVDKEPKQYRSFKVWGDELHLDLETAPSASATGTLTGTLTFTTDSTAVTGSSTLFTTELEEGFYIQPSGGSTWYRIASITDDTNLVLTAVAESDDNGADTADSTKYWREYAYLFCRKIHTLTTLTDLAGAIDLVAGYNAGAVLIHVDVLGSGTIPKNTILTIAGVPGSYRVTADATIGSNETDITISPGLAGRAPNNAVVTIRPSSLTPELERLLPELVAARVALNWIGDTRTSVDAVRVILDTVSTELGKVGARLTNAVAHIASGAGEITDKRAAAIAELDLAPQMILDAETDLDAATSLINKVTRGDNPVGERIASARARLANVSAEVTLARGYLSQHSTGIAFDRLAGRELQAGNGYASESTGYINEAMARLRTDTLQLTRMQTWAKYKLERTLETLRGMEKPKLKSFGYSRS